MHKLVKLISNVVKPYPKPAVNISGGIDSTVILHHLNEQTDEPIHTYTIGFPDCPTEFEYAEKVARHYGTVHHTILIQNMLEEYKKILHLFPQPRFNLWPYWLAREAYNDGRESCYIGEGGDEHFGGYWYKPRKTYIENWTGFFIYVYPTYKTIYDSFGLKLIVPLHPDSLHWQNTISYYDNDQNKRLLREAYTGILPDFVVNRKKLNGRFSYWVMWKQELQKYFPDSNPESEDDIRGLLNRWVTQEWLSPSPTLTAER